MRQELKYSSYLLIAVGVFVAFEIFTPDPVNWTVTYRDDDKNPYGGYVFSEVMQDVFPGKSISNSVFTLYELDTLPKETNLFVLASHLNLDELDTKTLLERVAAGGSALLSANSFDGTLRDTLSAWTSDYFFYTDLIENITRADTAGVFFKNPQFANHDEYYFRRNNIPYCFVDIDTARMSVIAENDLGYPVALRIKWGEGNLILNSTPIAFTNNYMLYQNNSDYVAKLISHLPVANLHWTQYYQIGRMEALTPLRFILNNEALRWAYYLSILSLLVFIMFESKRKQRVIPIIKPLKNTSVEFAKTLGNLYLQGDNHKNIAKKQLHYFLEGIRTKYNLPTNKLNSDFFKKLANKSGNPTQKVMDLFAYVAELDKKPALAKEDLLTLNKKLTEFHHG